MAVKDFASALFGSPFQIECVRQKIKSKADPKNTVAELDGGIASAAFFIVVQSKLNAKVSLPADQQGCLVIAQFVLLY